jgi:hypothetical protein
LANIIQLFTIGERRLAWKIKETHATKAAEKANAIEINAEGQIHRKLAPTQLERHTPSPRPTEKAASCGSAMSTPK